MAAAQTCAPKWRHALSVLLVLSLGASLAAAGGDIAELGPGGLRDVRSADHVLVRVYDSSPQARATEMDFILASTRFDHVDSVRCRLLGVASGLGVGKGEDLPQHVLVSRADDSNYRHEGSDDVDGLVGFVEAQTGHAALASAVQSLTAADLDRTVFHPKRHVLVEFYAPWCFHCKRIAPTYERLAHAFEDERSVVVAKLDAAAEGQAASAHNVKGFPSLLFFPASAKRQRMKYEGGRSLEALVSFLNKQAGTQRAPDGSISDDAGTLPALDQLAERFVAASADEEAARVADVIEEDGSVLAEAASSPAARRETKAAAGNYGSVARAVLRAVGSDEAGKARRAAVEAALQREKDAVAAKLESLPRGRAMHNRLRKKQNVLRRFLPDPLPAGKVAALGEAQFARYVGKGTPALVEFYAPWCPHCQQLAPVLEEVAAELEGADVLVAKVDTSEHQKLSKRFNIKGLPTLKWFKAESKKAETYNGGRSKSAILNYIRGRIDGSSKDEL